MAHIFQALKIRRREATNKNAKYTVTYKRVTKTKIITDANGVTSKYTYTTYEKTITPKQSLSY